jgi:hypothetical protein
MKSSHFAGLLLTSGLGSSRLRTMAAYRHSGKSRLRAGLMIGAVLPLALCLFLLPEPSDSQADAYLPSSRARNVSVKVIKSLKSFPAERTGNGDLALSGHAPALASFIASSSAAGSPIRRHHFAFLSVRSTRSPPSFPL